MTKSASVLGVLALFAFFSTAGSGASAAERPKLSKPDEIVRKIEDGKQYCYAANGHRVPCPMKLSETTMSPTPTDKCADEKVAWSSGYQEGLSGTSYHASLVPKKGLRLRLIGDRNADEFEVPACRSFLSIMADSGNSTPYQCCLDAYYKGAEQLWKKLDDFYALEDAAKAKLPERERMEMEECYKDRMQGSYDGAQQCDFYATAKNAYMPPEFRRNCPKVEFWMVDYRGCYMMGFLSQVTFCDCPFSQAAMGNLRQRAPQIYQHREDHVKSLAEELISDLPKTPGATKAK